MPGVPPNALGQLKDAFKNLLRPGRKRKEQQQQAQSAQQQDEQTAAASQPDGPPKLPPTHQHSEPQTALPKPGAAAAAAPAVVAGSEGAATKEQVNKQGEDKAPVSPVTPAPAPVAKDEASKTEPVSAVSTEHDKPLPMPKTDGANDVKAAAPLTSQPTTHEPLTATSENAKPSVIAPTTTTAPATTAPAPTTETAQPATKTSSESARDEKMPVMAEEPPEIKAKAAAPGMSATSGPLDDFDFPIEDDKP